MLLPREYFAVYGDKLSVTSNPKEAWWETEKEFNRRYNTTAGPEVLRRFKSYESFCESYRLFRNGVRPGHIEIVILEVDFLSTNDTGAK